MGNVPSFFRVVGAVLVVAERIGVSKCAHCGDSFNLWIG